MSLSNLVSLGIVSSCILSVRVCGWCCYRYIFESCPHIYMVADDLDNRYPNRIVFDIHLNRVIFPFGIRIYISMRIQYNRGENNDLGQRLNWFKTAGLSLEESHLHFRMVQFVHKIELQSITKIENPTESVRWIHIRREVCDTSGKTVRTHLKEG